MSRAQVAQLLMMRATFHGVTVGETDVEAWFATIGDLDYDRSVAALVRHYSVSREWLMPVDLRPVDQSVPEAWR